MPVTNWNTTFINGKEYLVVEVAQFRIPLEWDPSSNMFFAVAAPTGGLGNFPALVKGDDGATPHIDTNINFTSLSWDDPTPEFASWTETSPNVYRMNLGIRGGEPGPDGTMTLLNASDVSGIPLSKDLLVVNPSASGFIYQAQKVGDRFYPAAYNNTPSGNAGYTLATVPVQPHRFDWRPTVEGQCVITGTGADVTVDLVCRLNNETSGPIVGGALGQPGINPPTHVLSAAPILVNPALLTDTYDKVLANAGAVIYLRAERRSGTNTFTTSSATTSFRVKVDPVP